MLVIDIQDQNDSDHRYGQYDWENANVSDNRFMVVPDATDGSKATLMLKPGESLQNVDRQTTLKIMVEATPKGDIGDVVKIMVTANVQNSDGSTAPPTPTSNDNDVPGLKDNDSDGDNDVVEGDDSDTDGGIIAATLDDGLF